MTDEVERKDDPFPRWSEPATVGEVLQAMIWTKGLCTALFRLIAAYHSGDIEKMNEALDRYSRESDEFAGRIDLIAGAHKDA